MNKNLASVKTLLLLFWLITAPLLSQEKDLFSFPVITEETMAQFKKIAGKLQENKIVRSEFKQSKSIKALKRPLLSNGIFLIALEKGLYFETTKPFEQLTVITPEYLIQKDSGGSISKLNTDAHPLLQKSTESFLAIFSGKTDSLYKQYDIFLIEEDGNWQIGLTPKTNNESSQYIGKIIFKGSIHLDALIMVEKSGNVTTIEFSNHKVDQGNLSEEEIKKFELKK